GEYTFSIFAVVTIAVIVSWFVAVLFAPLLGVWFLKKPDKPASTGPGGIEQTFRTILVGAMRWRWFTLTATLACFAASLWALSYVPRQFFPASDRPELVVDLTLPRNASIFASDTVAGKLDGMLKGDPDVASWSTYVGGGAIRFYLPLDVQLPNDFFSQVRSIALKLGQIMGADANLRLVNFDWIEPSREVRIKIDQDQAQLVGLSSQALAEVLNTVMTGTPVTQVRDDIYLVNVVARANDEQRVSLSTLRSLQLPLPNGRAVPLSQVATFDFEQENPLIWRRDRVPTLTVQADLNGGATPEMAVRS